MTFWKPGDRALLRRPGADADHAVHRLLEAGLRVDVETQTPGPRLLDLQSRGLVGIVAHPDLDDYAVVLRDDVHRGRGDHRGHDGHAGHPDDCPGRPDVRPSGQHARHGCR